MYGITTLHHTSSIFTIIEPRVGEVFPCTVQSYVGEDVWMEESEVKIPYTHAQQDPLAAMCMAFMPWWPSEPHSLPAIEQCKEA